MNAAIAGTFPPNVAPEPRDAAIISCELRAAADRLAYLAKRVASGACEGAISDLDSLALGVSRAACELRQGGRE